MLHAYVLAVAPLPLLSARLIAILLHFLLGCLHMQTQREHGNKWRHIVDDYLPWRSPNDLKNYCNQYISSKGSQVNTDRQHQ